MIYLDDGIVAAKEFEATNRTSLIVRNDLQRAGLVVSVQKSIWVPVQTLTWLCFDLDLTQGVVSVPISKNDNLRGQLTSLQNWHAAPASRLQVLLVRLFLCLLP